MSHRRLLAILAALALVLSTGRGTGHAAQPSADDPDISSAPTAAAPGVSSLSTEDQAKLTAGTAKLQSIVARMQACSPAAAAWTAANCIETKVLTACQLCAANTGGDACMKTGSFPSDLYFQNMEASTFAVMPVLSIALGGGKAPPDPHKESGCHVGGAPGKKFCEGVALPAGTDKVTRHRPKQDTPQSPVYTPFTAAELLKDEAELNTKGNWLMDENKSCSMGWGTQALVDIGLSSPPPPPPTVVQENTGTIRDYYGVLQTNDSGLVTNLMTYSAQLRGDQCATAKAIYERLQKSFVQNNNTAGDYSMGQAIQAGTGVCRHGAVLLAEALKADGIECSVVFSPHHAWVRAVIDGRVVDLDPNAYQDFFPVPPRMVNSCQMVPVP